MIARTALPGYRRSRHDRIDDRRPAGRRGRRRDHRPGQLRPRPPGEPGPGAGRAAGSGWTRATSATPDLVRPLMSGHRRRVPPGRDPDHPVRGGAAAGARGPGRRHLRGRRGGRRRGRPQGRRRLLRVRLRAGRPFPDHRSASTRTATTRCTAPPRRSTRGCCAASTRCAGWTTWRCATSTSTGRGWTSTASTPRS